MQNTHMETQICGSYMLHLRTSGRDLNGRNVSQ